MINNNIRSIYTLYGLVVHTHGRIHLGDSDQRSIGQNERHTHMVKTAVILICVFVVPGMVMGLISSYRAGQRPHRDLYLKIKKFARRK